MPAGGRSRAIFETLKTPGFTIAVAVPDSWIGGLMAAIDAEPGMTLIRATHKEEGRPMTIDCDVVAEGQRVRRAE